MATNKTVATAVGFSFVAIIGLSSILISTALTHNSITSNTNAQSADFANTELCTMSINAYVDEIDVDGNQSPLNLRDNPIIDPAKWSFADTINLPPYNYSPIYFNHPTIARYDAFVSDLSFHTFPDPSSIYTNFQNSTVQLIYQDDEYQIVRREIQKCSTTDDDAWLCGDSNTSDDLTLISDLPVKCDMELDFGWVVKKLSENDKAERLSNQNSVETQFSKTGTIGFITTDLNHDGITNAIDVVFIIESYGTRDPLADVNKDGKVNILDYTMVLDDILADNS